MAQFNKTYFILLCITLFSGVFSQTKTEVELQENPFYLESSIWSLMNFSSDGADFYQLIGGYHLTHQDILTLDLITWKYGAPLGIPWGPSFDDPAEDFPGYVRSFGLGLGYQRFYWKHAFVSISALSILQNYIQNEPNQTSQGYQLFIMIKAGYQFEFHNGKYFVKPAIDANFWPIEKGMPSSFQNIENKWNNFFFPEPHLNFGVNF